MDWLRKISKFQGEKPKVVGGPTPSVTTPTVSVAATTPAKNIEGDKDPLSRRFGKARTAIPVGTHIQGKLSFDTPVRIDGKLAGEVFSSAPFFVGPKGEVEIEAHVTQLIVAGNFKGVVTATERVEILSGASVEGTIVSPVLVVEEGATLIGLCSVCAIDTKPSIPGLGVSVARSTESCAVKETPISQINTVLSARDPIAGM